MKKLLCLLAALCLTSAILIVVATDVNHGRGPGYHHDDHYDDDHNGEHSASGGH